MFSRSLCFSTVRALFILALLSFACGCLAVMAEHTYRPGARSRGETAWPLTSQIPLADERFTAVLFVHPHCPCARASLEMTEGLLARYPERLAVQVVFVLPEGTSPGWEIGELWSRVGANGKLVRIVDATGAEARRFGAVTSGHLFLFNAAGDKLFDGGVTPGRGHRGPCAGAETIERVLRGQQSAPSHAPVYGCPLNK
ncbi:MAG: hypothetical protein ACTHOU_16320 [Aureliella sp.]|jgi:hypothetical protein